MLYFFQTYLIYNKQIVKLSGTISLFDSTIKKLKDEGGFTKGQETVFNYVFHVANEELVFETGQYPDVKFIFNLSEFLQKQVQRMRVLDLTVLLQDQEFFGRSEILSQQAEIQSHYSLAANTRVITLFRRQEELSRAQIENDQKEMIDMHLEIAKFSGLNFSS